MSGSASASSTGRGTTPPLEIDSLWSKARPDPNGLLPCVVQDVRTRHVLMVAWVSKVALERALETGLATFWSRSRRQLWEKGATSGHRQRLVHVRLDCDGDTLLYLVEAQGPTCHEGYTSCFSWRRVGNGWRRDPDESDQSDAPTIIPPHPQLVVDLLEAGADLAQALPDSPELAAPPASRSLRPEKAIRVGAPIESRARAVANALQLKQIDKARDAAVALIAEIAKSLGQAGVSPAELRDRLTSTERAPPATAVGPLASIGDARPSSPPASAPGGVPPSMTSGSGPVPGPESLPRTAAETPARGDRGSGDSG